MELVGGRESGLFMFEDMDARRADLPLSTENSTSDFAESQRLLSGDCDAFPPLMVTGEVRLGRREETSWGLSEGPTPFSPEAVRSPVVALAAGRSRATCENEIFHESPSSSAPPELCDACHSSVRLEDAHAKFLFSHKHSLWLIDLALNSAKVLQS